MPKEGLQGFPSVLRNLCVVLMTGSVFSLAAVSAADLRADAMVMEDTGELRLEEVKSGRSFHAPNAVESLRAEALRESGRIYGARAGWYARTREIHRMLEADAGRLDRLFPFAPLLLAHHVTPPVLQMARDTVRKSHDAQLRFADAVYEIVAPAKLSVTPPDWRTYLFVQAARPQPPDATLQPDRDQAGEVAVWEAAVEHGWHQGIRQANRTFEVQLNRLERDLRGMALYRELLAKGMVTAPRLAEQWRGVTQQGVTLSVNDRLLEIAENTHFVSDNQRWKPYPARPYSPAKQAPSLHLRVLDTPAEPAPVAPSVPVMGEAFGWQH
ncbi:MAG: type IV secretory system conjugative DNA transfer family protein [Gammaproteobacteria bacterium]|nr:type IV secretory system conjugative DNA transfer family protein [Gammaproteobacteria bacterium]